jgi:hypothetical protein
MGVCLLALILITGITQAQQGVRFKGQAITEPLGPNDAPSYAVQGRVTSAEGAGLGGITVRIFTDGWEGATTSTRGDGYYDFAGLSFGNYNVTLLGVEADTIISGRVDGRTRVIVNFVRSPLATATPAESPTPAGPTLTPTQVPPTHTPIPATLPTIIFIRTATPLPAGTPKPAEHTSILGLFNLDFNIQLPDFRPLGNAFCFGGFCFTGLLVFVGAMSVTRALFWPNKPYRPREPRFTPPKALRQRRSTTAAQVPVRDRQRVPDQAPLAPANEERTAAAGVPPIVSPDPDEPATEAPGSTSGPAQSDEHDAAGESAGSPRRPIADDIENDEPPV